MNDTDDRWCKIIDIDCVQVEFRLRKMPIAGVPVSLSSKRAKHSCTDHRLTDQVQEKIVALSRPPSPMELVHIADIAGVARCVYPIHLVLVLGSLDVSRRSLSERCSKQKATSRKFSWRWWAAGENTVDIRERILKRIEFSLGLWELIRRSGFFPWHFYKLAVVSNTAFEFSPQINSNCFQQPASEPQCRLPELSLVHCVWSLLPPSLSPKELRTHTGSDRREKQGR